MYSFCLLIGRSKYRTVKSRLIKVYDNRFVLLEDIHLHILSLMMKQRPVETSTQMRFYKWLFTPVQAINILAYYVKSDVGRTTACHVI